MAHPQTRRSYVLRSYLVCDLCGRRMFGKTRRKGEREYTYYACVTNPGDVPLSGGVLARHRAGSVLVHDAVSSWPVTTSEVVAVRAAMEPSER